MYRELIQQMIQESGEVSDTMFEGLVRYLVDDDWISQSKADKAVADRTSAEYYEVQQVLAHWILDNLKEVK